MGTPYKVFALARLNIAPEIIRVCSGYVGGDEFMDRAVERV